MNDRIIMHILSSGSNGGIEVMMANYARYTALKHVFVFVWDRGPNYDRIQQSGFQTYFLDCRRNGALKTAVRACQIAREVKPAVVVTHHGSGYVRLLGELVRRNSPSCRHYAYCHSSGYDQLLPGKSIKERALNELNRYGIRHAQEVIAISDAVKESVHSCFRVKNDKIRTIYNGADIDRFSGELHQRGNRVHFAYAGRLIEVKGVQVTLKALSQLPGETDWDFTVVGDGDYKERLMELCRTLSIENRVSFLGNCTDVPERIRNTDIFIHACLWEEGFGISIVEAMAAGKICIASAAGGIPEIIEDGVDGFLFEKGNTDQLVRIIRKLLEDGSSWSGIQNHAMEKAKIFSIQNYTKALDEALMD